MDVAIIDYTQKDMGLFSSSLQQTGFAVLEHHPIDSSLIDAIYDEWRLFFNSEEKQKYVYNIKTQDGFFPASISEKAKGATCKDLKEYFQYYPWGQYPQELSNKTNQLFNQLNQLAGTLLGWLDTQLPSQITNHLSMPLSKMITDSKQTMLRILHYPPLLGNEQPGAVRAAAHEDINLLTLLVGATNAGLQVKDNNGEWHNVESSTKSIVVNVGDMLDLATSHYYQSTTHRVINPVQSNTARLSMPFFLHAGPEVALTASKTAGQYLHERLIELGVI